MFLIFSTLLLINVLLAFVFAIVWPDDKALRRAPIIVIALLLLWMVFQITATPR
jgi:hypothetical protein